MEAKYACWVHSFYTAADVAAGCTSAAGIMLMVLWMN